MIYITENRFELQIHILQMVYASANMEAILWAYPEELAHSIGSLHIIENSTNIEPVTIYEDHGSKIRRTEPQLFDDQFIANLLSQKKTISAGFDSIALYNPGSTKWSSCAIPHEKMVLFRDDGVLPFLMNKGLSASTTAPEWW